MLPRDGGVRAKQAQLLCRVVTCESLHAIGSELVMLLLEFTINLLDENLCISMIVVDAFVISERETKDCCFESCAALVSDLVGLVHVSGDTCVAKRNP